MRVVQLGPFPPPHGGVQSNILAIRDYLRRHSVSCAVVNITGNRKPDADDVYYPHSAAALLVRLTRLRPGVIHLHVGGNYTARLLALSAVCSAWPGARSVLTLHSGGFPSSPQARLFKRGSWRATVLRGFDALIAVNSQISKFFEAAGVSPRKIHVIPPHALTEAPSPALEEPLASFYAAHNPILLSVGLLEPEYDLALQIRVLPRIRRHYPNAALVMIGSGSLEQDLRRIIASEPAVLLAGDVPHAQTLRAMQQSSILLRTTLYDGDSVAVREALHLGVPVIATDNGMRPEACLLMPPSNLASLESAILQVLAAPAAPRVQASAHDVNIKTVLDIYANLRAIPI